MSCCSEQTAPGERSIIRSPGPTGQLRTTLASYGEEGWIVLTSDGRVDTDQLEIPGPIHWIANDEPFDPLPAEVFMRDYYEGRLLARLLADDPSLQKRIRPLSSLDRTQPYVSEPDVQSEGGGSGLATVRVRVRNVTSDVQRDAQGGWRQTGVYDLRLFRDGQLVGWAPRSSTAWQAQSGERGNEPDGVDLAGWRKANEVTRKLQEVERAEPDGKMVVRFEHVRW